MKRVCGIGAASLILAFLSGAAAAADGGAAGKAETVIMEDVVVTATRYEEEVFTVPAAVDVITAEEIAASTAKDVPGVLRYQAGVHVTDINGNRRAYRVDLRGFGETAALNTLVLVDGRRVNQPDLSGADWTLIPLNRIKRIEVIRGGRGSVLYGDNASGGVVNIITKEGEEFSAGVGYGAGSYNTSSPSAFLSGSQGIVSYALSGSHYDSDGYRDNSESTSRDLGVNLGCFLGTWGRLGLSGGYHDDDTGMPGALRLSELASGLSRRDSVNPADFAEVDDVYIKAKPEFYFLQNSLFQVDTSIRERNTLFFSSFAGGTFEGDTAIDTAIFSPQVVFREPVFGFHNALTLGVDYVNAEEDISNTTVFFGAPSSAEFSLEKTNHGYFIHDEFNLTDRLALSAGYRHDKVEYAFEPGTPDEADYDQNLYTAGVNYQFLEGSSVYFSFSRSFRYPVLDELFDFFTNTINTGLQPQTSNNYEFGLRHHITPTLSADLNFFRIETDDEIFFNPTGGPFGFGANENLDGKTRRDGVEISLSKRFDRFFLRCSYTYTDSEIRSGQFGGNRVPGVPEHMASAEAVVNPFRGFTLAVNGTYVGKRFFESDFSNRFPEQDDYTVLNAKFTYQWRNWNAFLDLKNFLDEEYSEFGVLSGPPVEPAFYPSPEFNFLVGVRVAY